MAATPLKRLATGIAPPIAMVIVVLGSLALMTEATQGSAHFGQLYSVLLVIIATGLLGLAALITHNLLNLLRQVRAGEPGARLTARMTTVFVLLAVSPVLVVFYFSLQFLHQGIDSWFDVRIERALDDAIELGRASLGANMRERLNQTELLAAELSGLDEDELAGSLEDARRMSGASELTLLGPQGHIVAFSNVDPTEIVPFQPSDSILVHLRQSGSYIGLDPIADVGLHVRVVVNLSRGDPIAEPRVLQALFPVAERMRVLADAVESAHGKYRELAYLRKPLKWSFTLTLSLVLLLGLLTAVWAALLSARRIAAPLREVAFGTQAVAAGDYGTRLPPAGKDEVGFLVTSFNEMTDELARARDETRYSQRQVEEQRRYLEAVLGRLSSGVLTLDQDARLHTSNHAAEQILEAGLAAEAGQSLEEIASRFVHLAPLAQRLVPHVSGGEEQARDWREEVTLFGSSGRKILMLSGTGLAEDQGPSTGHVIVFDDVTALIQAQRSEAWSEVARRLAHEIKNPLTPIQLSAERLRHKYLENMSPAEGELLDRLTRTIVAHVQSLIKMVNAFSDYARSPQLQPEAVDLNALADDVLELYRDERREVTIETDLAADLPLLDVDPNRLRQVLHNLVKNALEACGQDEPARVRIETRCVSDARISFVEMRITDAGPGFPDDIVAQAFEPYITTKPKGTGLGLAIVKKIVEEHSGMVWAENRPAGGAQIIIQFPVPEQTGDDPGPRVTALRREAV